MLIRNIAYSAALVVALAQTALAEGAQVAFGGLKADTTAQVEMNADTLTVSQTDGTAVFSGNVVVSQGAMKLSANEVRVAYGADKTSIETLYATGNVLLVNASDAAQADNAASTMTARPDAAPREMQNRTMMSGS